MESSYVPDILIFTLDGCGPCIEQKQYLENKGYAYREVKMIDELSLETFDKIYPNAEGFPHIILDGNEVFDLALILESGL